MLAAMTKRWKRRPEGSTWGDFGPDDERGRLNLITPERVRQAVGEVKEGRTFCLSLPLDYPGGRALNPRRFPPELRSIFDDVTGTPRRNFPMSLVIPGRTDVMNDEAMLLCSQYSTQWDALSHVGSHFDADDDGVAERVYYNGFRPGEHVSGPIDYRADGSPVATGQALGASALGVDRMAEACMQGRGVLVDLAAHFGRKRQLVGYRELRTVIEKDGVVVAEGDLLCLHTGFAAMLLEMARTPDPHALHHACAVLDGRDEALRQWITDSGIAALIADNYAVEAHPARAFQGACADLPLHQHCLFKLGVPLGELWHLSELAQWLRAHGRSRFLLTAPPLRMPGAVGSPVTPIATV